MHTPEDICKIMGGMTTEQALKELNKRGVVTDPDPPTLRRLFDLRRGRPEPKWLHPQPRDKVFVELVPNALNSSTRYQDGDLGLLVYRQQIWKVKWMGFDDWHITRIETLPDGEQVEYGYAQSYYWYVWELQEPVVASSEAKSL